MSVPSCFAKDLFSEPLNKITRKGKIMGTSLDKIDDMIAYIESPEYLRMVASAQGENASALLGTTHTPDTIEPMEWEFTPAPPVPVRAFRGPNAAARERVRTRQLTTRDGWWKFGECLGSRVPFKTHGKFYGTETALRDPGHLPTMYAQLYSDELPHIDYVVYSYWTPIAWHVTRNAESFWVYPQARYSVTTSRHQTKIRTALAESGEDVRP